MQENSLSRFRSSSVADCDTPILIDLKSVAVDPALSPGERLQSFLDQIKNPYLFKVGDLAVGVRYAGGKPFDAALLSLLSASP